VKKPADESAKNVADFRGLLEALSGQGVECVLVGGVAAMIHGSARLTHDIDIVYSRSRENIERLVMALGGHRPYLRGAPPGLPFRWDVKTLQMGLNFTLVTTLGDIDILGEVAGGGTYEQLLPHSSEYDILGLTCRCVDLPTLIRLKRAAGRPKDLEALAELEAILEEREDQS
jgi:predicted nucleotidyltransferase